MASNRRTKYGGGACRRSLAIAYLLQYDIVLSPRPLVVRGPQGYSALPRRERPHGDGAEEGRGVPIYCLP